MESLTTDAVGVGVDVGQRSDPTAIVVAERELRGSVAHFNIRLIERMPLGTPYPEVAQRVTSIDRQLRHQARMTAVSTYEPAFPVTLRVDATGIGQAIIDLLEETGLQPVACYFTGSDKQTERGHRMLSVGKAAMVGRLQVLLNASRIHLPQGTEATALVRELENYEIRVNDHAHAQFGAFRTGTHDDLVTALGLAVGFDDGDSRVVVEDRRHPSGDSMQRRMEAHRRWRRTRYPHR